QRRGRSRRGRGDARRRPRRTRPVRVPLAAVGITASAVPAQRRHHRPESEHRDRRRVRLTAGRQRAHLHRGGVMLEENQVRLTRSSGSLLMGPGTPYTILPGWDPWSRTNRSPQTQPRPYSHGALVGAEWVDAPTVLIPVSIYRSRASQSTWM